MEEQIGSRNTEAPYEQEDDREEDNLAHMINIRKNDQGIIPFGLKTQWQQHDFTIGGNTSLLADIREAGPYDVGGRTRALLIDLSDEDRYFAGATSGGLWVSENAGASWEPLSDDASNMNISCITQNPFNHNEIYYGTGEAVGWLNGLYGDGIFKSSNGGATFYQLTSTANANFGVVWDIVHSPVQDDVLFAATSQGVWKSDDGGANWTEVYQATYDVTDIEILPNGHVYIVEWLVGPRVSYFSGTSYGNFVPPAGSGLPNSGFGRMEVAFCQSQPTTVYILNTAPFELYKLVGPNWVTINLPASFDLSQLNVNLIMGVDPDDPDNLFIGGVKAIYSTNGGTSWNSLKGGHDDYHSYAFHTSNPNEFLIGNDGGVYRMNWTNLGADAEDLNSGYNVTQFYAGNYFVNGHSYLGGTQDNGTQRLLSHSWERIKGGDGGYTAISLQNPALAYYEQQQGVGWRTEDIYDQDPTDISITADILAADDVDFITPFEIDRSNGDRIYFASAERIWRTTNKGDNWQPITISRPSMFPNTIALSRGAVKDVYFASTASEIYKIPNASSAFAGDEFNISGSLPSGIDNHNVSCIKVHPNDNDIAYVTLSSISNLPRIYRVSGLQAGSLTWTDISGNLPASLPCFSIVIDPKNEDHLVLGTDFGLYCSDDGGQNWHKEHKIPNTLVSDLRLRETDRRLFISTYGRGVWTASLSGGSAASYAQIPYQTSFEAGVLDEYWTTGSSHSSGRTAIRTDHDPLIGFRHMLLDVESNNGIFVTNHVDFRVDISNHNNVVFSYWWKRLGDEEHPEDGLFLSDDDGQTFTKITNPFSTGSNNTWYNHSLNLAVVAWANGLDYNSRLVVRFQQRDNYPASSDGIAIDFVSITGSPILYYASLPYSTGFESGTTDQYWHLNSTNSANARNEVTTTYEPESGLNHLRMDVVVDNLGFNTNEAWLRLNLSGESDVHLQFSWKEYGDENHSEDGVFISDDGGATFTKILSLVGGSTGVWNNVDLDLSQMIVANGLSHSNNFVVKFQQRDNYAMPSDGIAIDNINVQTEIDDIGFGLKSAVHSATDSGLINITQIYPNPAQDYVNVVLKSKVNDVEASIYDLNGKEVLKAWLKAGVNRLDIGHLPSGSYTVVVPKNGGYQTHKLIKL